MVELFFLRCHLLLKAKHAQWVTTPSCWKLASDKSDSWPTAKDFTDVRSVASIHQFGSVRRCVSVCVCLTDGGIFHKFCGNIVFLVVWIMLVNRTNLSRRKGTESQWLETCMHGDHGHVPVMSFATTSRSHMLESNGRNHFTVQQNDRYCKIL